MGIEFVLIGVGVAILIAVLARRRVFEKRLIENRESLSDLDFRDEVPVEVTRLLSKAPQLKGDGKFAFQAVGCILFAHNFEAIRIAKRIYFVEPTEIKVLLLPNPSNFERKLAVAITVDSKVLGYVPSPEAEEMHKYLLAHSSGVFAKAKIYIGSRTEYNGIRLDFSKPLRLESRRK